LRLEPKEERAPADKFLMIRVELSRNACGKLADELTLASNIFQTWIRHVRVLIDSIELSRTDP